MVQMSVLSVGCLVLAVHGWFAVAFACAVFCVVRGDARSLRDTLMGAKTRGS